MEHEPFDHAPPQTEADGSQFGARRYANRHAKRIARNGQLRTEIEALFRLQGRTTEEILTTMNGSLGLNDDVKHETNLGVINRVVAMILPEDARTRVYSLLRSEIFDEKSREKIKEARAEWQTKQGLVVFSDEESEYLFDLRELIENKKGKHVDNGKIAAAMSARFGPGRFTRDNCRQHAANKNFLRQKKINAR